MSVSPRCAARSRRSRAFISLASQHVLVESSMHDLGSCAAPVVPDLGGKCRRKAPSLKSSKAPTRSTHILVRDNSLSSRRSPPPRIGFLLPSWQGGGNHSHKWLPSVAPPVALVMSWSVAKCSRDRLIRAIHPIPSPCGLLCQGHVCYTGGVLSRQP
jgi:hypothetical protein